MLFRGLFCKKSHHLPLTSLKPPPHEQLGYFVQNSINADPDKLTRTLREDPNLPFQDLTEATSSHLTVGPPPPKPCEGCLGIQAVQYEDTGGMANWATVPVALLSVMIGSLVILFLGRRVWKRRREVSDTHIQTDMLTRDFATSDLDIDKEKFGEQSSKGEEEEEDPGKSKKSKKKKKSKKYHEDEISRESTISGGSNPQVPFAEEDDSSSSSSSEDSEEKRRRRKKDKRKSKIKSQRRPFVEEGDSSSSSSEDSEEKRGRRKKDKRKSKIKSQMRICEEEPPTLADLNRSKSRREDLNHSKSRRVSRRGIN